MLQRLLAIVVLGLLAWAPARAETYKWVDERGVVNYSNSPAAGKSTRVEERLSTYQSPPLQAAVANRAPDYEWLQRQRIMAQMAAAKQVPADCGYRVDCSDAYWPAYGYAYAPVIAVRAAHRGALRTRGLRSSFR
jgi:hypothetical protein